MERLLSVFPPDAKIFGKVGDKGSYFRFETTAANARTDISAACAKHAAQEKLYFERGYVTSPTSCTSYWFYEEVTIDLPGFPGVTITLDVDNNHPNILKDPWVVRSIDVNHGFYDWDKEPKTAKMAAEHFAKLAQMFEQISIASLPPQGS